MKQAKKLLALVMVLAMVMSLGITAFAAEAGEDAAPKQTITFQAEDKHTYEIYQIFTGDLENGGLVNVKYGVSTVKEGEEVDYNYLKSLETKKGDELATEVGTLLSEPAVVYTTRTNETKVEVDPGYYYIVDTGIEGDDEAPISKIIIEVAKDVTITPKRPGTPTAEKKVKDINDSETTEYTEWQDSADHDIGDKVPFQITVKIPEGINQYDFYKMNVKDTQSKGLTLDEASFEIKMGDKTLEKDVDWTFASETTEAGETKFTIAFADVKSFANGGETIVITYQSELNGDAVIGSKGNPNEMYLEYSNNPDNDKDFGKTPVDKVIVFTYKTVVNKVDNKGESLKGAKFTLYKKVVTGGSELEGHEGSYKPITVTSIDEETTFNFVGLDDGEYVLVETEVPTGYNKAKDIEFTISATHETEADDPKMLDFSGKDESGNVANFTTSWETGTGSTNVVNNKGVELPSTGGIGTTIFYVVGSMMMLAAAVLLITRKKMSAYQD